ncbi:hypothetical protein [Nocardioides sp. KR10-350]|uniref:hypothetical protein n=1 Tax=Nocardioides cheoyonin TaxID=3156615 RepID=UPI0032B384F7
MGGSLGTLYAVRAGLAAAMMLALSAVFVQLHVGLLVGLLGYVGSCGLAALLLPLRYAVLTGLTGWALLTGFVVNVGGRLTFASGDLQHLAVLIALSAAVSVSRPAGRRAR